MHCFRCGGDMQPYWPNPGCHVDVQKIDRRAQGYFYSLLELLLTNSFSQPARVHISKAKSIMTKRPQLLLSENVGS